MPLPFETTISAGIELAGTDLSHGENRGRVAGEYVRHPALFSALSSAGCSARQVRQAAQVNGLCRTTAPGSTLPERRSRPPRPRRWYLSKRPPDSDHVQLEQVGWHFAFADDWPEPQYR